MAAQSCSIMNNCTEGGTDRQKFNRQIEPQQKAQAAPGGRPLAEQEKVGYKLRREAGLPLLG